MVGVSIKDKKEVLFTRKDKPVIRRKKVEIVEFTQQKGSTHSKGVLQNRVNGNPRQRSFGMSFNATIAVRNATFLMTVGLK